MVFVRRVQRALGATKVQTAEYVDGRQRIVRHVGSTHTEAEPKVPIARACPTCTARSFTISPSHRGARLSTGTRLPNDGDR